ncbi:hypothetical protein Tco_0608373 [Tanacetum coccineum]
MSSLAEFAILNGADNRPPMLDKLMYDPWKSRMEMYMENHENGYLILESIRNGPLVWPMIEENGEMKRKRVPKLSAPEKLQYEADVKATNIILQGVPANVYALMRLQQFQVNTKFLNSLPPEWSKFVTDVKLVKDLYVTNFDQLFAHIEHHEAHENEIRLLKEQSYDPLALITIYQQPQAISHIDYQPQHTKFPALDSGLAGPMFNKGDDLIDAINKMMSFLSTVGSDALADVNNHKNMDNNLMNQVVQAMPSSEQSSVMNNSETEITSDSNIIPYSHVNDNLTAELERYKERVKVLKKGQNVDLKSNDIVLDPSAQSVEIDRLKQTLLEHLKEKEYLMQTVTLLKNDFKKEESRNIDREIALENKIK